jgi:hypothetical protein
MSVPKEIWINLNAPWDGTINPVHGTGTLSHFVRADLAQAPAPVRVKPEDVFETCGACMGSGYGGHPDSGALCAECDGSGGQLVAALEAPDAGVVAELVDALRTTRAKLSSVLHSEFDGVWSEQDFLDELKEADVALAKWDAK